MIGVRRGRGPRALPRTATLLFLLLLGAPEASANFVVSGAFAYVDRQFNFQQGFTGVEPNLPIRFARVEVLNNVTSIVLATGATDANGQISIMVPGSGVADIVIRCYARSDLFVKPLRVTALSGLEFSVSSGVFPGWNLGNHLPMGTVIAQKVMSGSNQGNPFNMLDVMVSTLEYIKSVGGANSPVQLNMTWPSGGSFASGSSANIAADDGYDDIVQLHEFAHVIQNVYSDDDNPGGFHTFGQSDQDPRLSLGEGWATWFAAAVRRFKGFDDPGFYLDAAGQGQIGLPAVQVRMRLEDGFPYQNETGGEADEGAIFGALWDIVDDASTLDGNAVDDDPLDGSVAFAGGANADSVLWKMFIGPIAQASNATILDVWNAFFTPVDYGNHVALTAIFEAWKMHFSADADEANNSPQTATLHSLSPIASPLRTLFYSPTSQPGSAVVDIDYYDLPITSGSVVRVESRYPNDVVDAETYVDPFVRLYRPNGTLFATDDDSGIGRNARLQITADQTGHWIAEVTSIHPYRRSGSYQFRAELVTPPSSGCATLATLSVSGVGKGGAGKIPSLTAPNLPVFGSNFTLKVSNGPPGQQGWLIFGILAIDVPFDLGHLYVDPLHAVVLINDAAGAASLSYPVANPVLCGLPTHVQAFFLGDPASFGPYKSSHSGRLTYTIGG